MSKITIIVEADPAERFLEPILNFFKGQPDITIDRAGQTVTVKSSAKTDRFLEKKTTLADRFEALFQTWKTETALLSSGSAMVSHPAFEAIIRLGDHAIPFVLLKLQDEPTHLFYALYKMTGENPVPQTHVGNLPKMRADWLNWGREKGYLS